MKTIMIEGRWIETERQGRGRRYWFCTRAHAIAFHTMKCERGYIAIWGGGTTVWVPFAKRINSDIVDQLNGKDTES